MTVGPSDPWLRLVHVVMTDSLAADLSAYNNTYKSLRVIGDGYDLYYSVWCNNEHELYDMSVSPRFLKIFSSGARCHNVGRS